MPVFNESMLYASVCGDGSAVVLIPGLSGLGRFWQPVQALTAERFRTFAIDHPGMGSSPKGPQSIDFIAQQVVSLLNEWGIERAHVIGHSTGGLVAQALALDMPDRVNKVVLSSTWAKPDNRFRTLFKLRQDVLKAAGAASYVALGELLAYPSSWYESEIAASDPKDVSVDVELTLQRIDMLLSYDRSTELARIQTPVLVVGAPDDNIIPFQHSQELATRIPHARLVSLAGGHFTPTTAPLAYVELITAFLGELE